MQRQEFKQEIKILKSDKIPGSCRLVTLNPNLDEEGILRVGDRLKHSVLSEEVKHPILLPASHHFTMLIIIYYHKKLFHAGVQTLNAIREEF